MLQESTMRKRDAQINLRVPRVMKERIDAAAAARGLTLTEYCCQAIEARLSVNLPNGGSDANRSGGVVHRTTVD